MITFKDVAHLYVGCEVEVESYPERKVLELLSKKRTSPGLGILRNVLGNGSHLLVGGKLNLYDSIEKIQHVKPRLLSPHSIYKLTDEQRGNLASAGFDPQATSLPPIAVVVACRLGVDLFKLIENGEAIDYGATTL
jgi:hypothetical protein